MKPAMTAINVMLPDDVERFYQDQADKRLTSKAAVIREVLVKHAEKSAARRLVAETAKR